MPSLASLMENVSYHVIKGSAYQNIRCICSDSKEIQPGDVFLARKGTGLDGIDYAADAVMKGAAAVICRELSESVLSEILDLPAATVIITENVEDAERKMQAAFWGYPEKSLTLIAVTGTKGKTTVSSMIARILNTSGIACGLIGTNGAFWKDQFRALTHTTPPVGELYRLLAEMKQSGITHVAMEVSSLAVKQGRTAGFLFEYGVFTNLYRDHIGEREHRTMEEYRFWKFQLFRQVKYGIVNLDSEEAPALLEAYPRISWKRYSLKTPCELFLVESHFRLNHGIPENRFRIDGIIEKNDFTMMLPGLYNCSNALAAILVCSGLGVPGSTMADALRTFQVKGRTQFLEGPEHSTIVIDYAHNEEGLRHLLESLRPYCSGKLICLFGCGGNRSRERRAGMGRISGSCADLTVITEDNSRNEPISSILHDILSGIRETKGKYVVIQDRKEAIHFCLRHASENDLIVFAGKGHEEYLERLGMRTHFSEMELIKEYRNRKGEEKC